MMARTGRTHTYAPGREARVLRPPAGTAAAVTQPAVQSFGRVPEGVGGVGGVGVMRATDVAALQRMVGNRATTAMLAVQRMPDRAAVEAELGTPKKKSTYYRNVLGALDTYHKYAQVTAIGPKDGDLAAQAEELDRLLG